ncbi:glycosyltransferase family 8 protein [Paenibacillus thalictri]|uniref:glycosyltransferase family 8 protein n=1 Tax=Paenibacillus thalictri TaxID=2527873 RepID=UPI0013EEF92D|nr:glycosyltransferase family 8 protein [Paenibacillus thalictri]
MIELALAFNDKDGSYAEHAGVVLASVFYNTESQIRVHILHDDTLLEANKTKLIQLVKSFHQTIDFIHVNIPMDLFEAASNVKAVNIWTMASMYRLLLPQLVQTEKIIYLDCDVLVNLDIAELWNIELNDAYLGAVWDQGIHEVAHDIIPCGLSPENYFNSGILLLELNNIRNKRDWYEGMLNFLWRYPNSTLPDQDLLNSVFGENYLQLDLRFNLFNLSCPDRQYDNKIVHFSGAEKCWHPQSPGAELYARYLDMTPWGTMFIEAGDTELSEQQFDTAKLSGENEWFAHSVPEASREEKETEAADETEQAAEWSGDSPYMTASHIRKDKEMQGSAPPQRLSTGQSSEIKGKTGTVVKTFPSAASQAQKPPRHQQPARVKRAPIQKSGMTKASPPAKTVKKSPRQNKQNNSPVTPARGKIQNPKRKTVPHQSTQRPKSKTNLSNKRKIWTNPALSRVYWII